MTNANAAFTKVITEVIKSFTLPAFPPPANPSRFNTSTPPPPPHPRAFSSPVMATAWSKGSGAASIRQKRAERPRLRSVEVDGSVILKVRRARGGRRALIGAVRATDACACVWRERSAVDIAPSGWC